MTTKARPRARTGWVADDEFVPEVSRLSWVRTGGGYWRTYLKGRRAASGSVSLHRMVWALRYGDCPPFLDHINRDPNDNRIANLRPATARLNLLNRQLPSASGLPPGVSPNSPSNVARPFRAKGRHRSNGRKFNIGYFATAAEAGEAYQQWLAGEIEHEAGVAWAIWEAIKKELA